jgi:integrating conjugative element protein (TIGR03756 family)
MPLTPTVANNATPIIATLRVLTDRARALTLWMAISLIAPVLLATAPVAQAQTNTIAIATDTIAAFPSCARWRVRGVCSWLRCRITGCSIRTSFRVQHYMPEVVVSTWHDPTQHPWGDVGRLVSTAVTGVGSAILALPIDSAGTPAPAVDTYKFRDADAIGNPLVMLPQVLATGSMPDIPSLMTVPDYTEMLAFPSQLGAIAESWSNVPGHVAGSVVADARRLAELPQRLANLQNTLTTLPGRLQQLWSGANNVTSVLQGGVNATSVARALTGVDVSALSAMADLFGATSGGTMSTAIFCPGGTSPFGINFQSQLDALTWRGMLPVEMIYPEAWIPGMGEVGSFPANTWGPIFPRDGNITQTHPVKASAVLARRVADIITKPAQPHIYRRLNHGNGFRYFRTDGDIQWQRLHPNAARSCSRFGSNDSLGLTSYGDGNTTGGEGYSWNMWMRLECCQDRGSYLGSVTW